MAKFKCQQSGNVFEFVNEHDIKTMRSHPSYVEVIEVQVEELQETRKPGRPKKDTKDE